MPAPRNCRSWWPSRPAPIWRRFAELAQLQASVRSLADAVYDWGLAVGRGREGLQRTRARCHAEMEWAAKIAGTWLGRVREQAGDAAPGPGLVIIRSQLSSDRQEALRLRGVLTAHRVEIPDAFEPSLFEGLRLAKDRLSGSGKLGIVRRTGQAGSATIRGRRSAAEHF